MNEFRLHLVEREPIKTAPDVQAGLDVWAMLNQKPNVWATFEAIQLEYDRIVRVEWGMILSNGTKECACQTITYSLRKDGLVDVTRHTHS